MRPVKILAHFSTDQLNSILVTFLRSVENDLISNVSYKRKIKIEVVNDYLEQAEELLDKNEYHSAIAAFLIGASLEEFLRNWVAEQYLELENQKPSISTYAAVLRKNELLDKQDLKDITAWSGIRNDAAHGKWNLVDDKSKINVMLSGVSIFIKKYST